MRLGSTSAYTTKATRELTPSPIATTVPSPSMPPAHIPDRKTDDLAQSARAEQIAANGVAHSHSCHSAFGHIRSCLVRMLRLGP